MLPLAVTILFGFALAVPECPKFSTSFDYQTCDPTKRSQCPAGYTCRKGNDSSNPSATVFLCCDSSVMSVTDWFSDAELVPKVFPKFPVNAIKKVQLTSVDTQQGVDFPWVHIGDEVVLIPFPTYVSGMLDRVEFGPAPPAGGYLHFLTILDPGFHPFAIFFNYNQPSFGTSTVSISQNTNNRLAYVDNSSSVPLRNSYRTQYVVLVFRTPQAISLDQSNRILTNNPYAGSTDDAIAKMNGCKDVTCLLTNTTLGRELDEPIAGSLFYLTTKRTIFEMKDDGLTEKGASGAVFVALIVALMNFVM